MSLPISKFSTITSALGLQYLLIGRDYHSLPQSNTSNHRWLHGLRLLQPLRFCSLCGVIGLLCPDTAGLALYNHYTLLLYTISIVCDTLMLALDHPAERHHRRFAVAAQLLGCHAAGTVQGCGTCIHLYSPYSHQFLGLMTLIAYDAFNAARNLYTPQGKSSRHGQNLRYGCTMNYQRPSRKEVRTRIVGLWWLLLDV